MHKTQYRVESSHPIICPFLVRPDQDHGSMLFNDRALAVVVAAKSLTRPKGQEIRVVNTISGEVIYRKAEGCLPLLAED